MNYLDMLDSKPVALPNKPINIQLQKQNKGLQGEPEPLVKSDKKKSAISVNIVDSREKKSSSVNRDELKELLKVHSLSKISNTLLEPIENVNKPTPKPVKTNEVKAVKIPVRLSIIEEKDEGVTDTNAAPLADFLQKAPEPLQPPEQLPEQLSNIQTAIEAAAEKKKEKKEQKAKEKVEKEERERVELSQMPLVKLGKASLKERLKPPQPAVNIKVSSYYMNNREIFVNFINKMLIPYKNELMDDVNNITCKNIGKTTGDFDLLTHQKIVRDYLNLYTPYRGLLLYHGLGSGKTCTSIAIAEGIKTIQNVIIMTPASLRTNYMEELKKCGDYLYKRDQFWEWIPTNNQIEVENTLSKVLNIPLSNIRTNSGAWLVNVSKPSNYTSLDNFQRKSLDEQINLMISKKYQFINYNGLNRNILETLVLESTTNSNTENIFDNKVVIIDEAHNFISRIVNKINKDYKSKTSETGKDLSEPLPEYYLFPRQSKPSKVKPGTVEKKRNEDEPKPRYKHVSVALYDYLLNAKNAKIILLTGTPIINYPNEIAILYNILRGYIKSFSIDLDIATEIKIDKESLTQIFSREKILDTLDYTSTNNKLTITRNPFGFKSVIYSKDGYVGVSNEPTEKKEGIVLPGQVTDAEFISNIQRILRKSNVTFNLDSVKVTYYKALPDKLYEFSEFFMESVSQVKKMDEFKRRIIGLTSYFRSAQEELMPSYNPNFEPIEIEMSDYQFDIYETIREEEREMEKKAKKQKTKKKADVSEVYVEPKSTFKIFSRMFCNFVTPYPPGRPTPKNIYDSISERVMKEFMESEAFRDIREGAEASRAYDRTEQGKAEFIARQEALAAEAAAYKQAKTDKAQQKIARASAKEQENAAKLLKQTARAQAKEEDTANKAAKLLAKEQEKAAKALAKEQEKAAKKTKKKSPTSPKNASKKTKKKSPPKTITKLQIESDDSDESIKKIGKLMDNDEFKQAGGATDDEGDSDSESETEAATAQPKANEEASNKFSNFIGRMDNIQDGQDMEEDIDIDELMTRAASKTQSPGKANMDTEKIYRDKTREEAAEVYKREVANLLNFLRANKNKIFSPYGPNGLRKYSPKFLRMIENITNPEHIGLNLVYSQFRTLEGIGIFSIALEANGFAQFKIKRSALTWEIDMSEDDWAKPHYALYTGTEDAEEKEIIRKIYNGEWDKIPETISVKLRERNHNNNVGEIIKVLMITASGSEGINLRNTRYVHIMEPYWNPVRAEQVIGRARRICSHQALPLELQTVEVFLYLMIFSQSQIERASIELKLNDVSKINIPNAQNIDKNIVFTSEQTLHEISYIKKTFTSQIMKAIKEASIDCATHVKGNTKEGLQCLNFGEPDVDERSFFPNIMDDEKGNASLAKTVLTKQQILWKPQDITIKGILYVQRVGTDEIYDYASYERTKANQASENPIPGVEPILKGHLTKKDGVTKFKRVVE